MGRKHVYARGELLALVVLNFVDNKWYRLGDVLDMAREMDVRESPDVISRCLKEMFEKGHLWRRTNAGDYEYMIAPKQTSLPGFE